MKWLLGYIASFFTSFLTFFVKRFGYQAVLFVALKSFQILMIAVLLAFFVFTTSFLINLWGVISTFINDFQNISVGAGVTYGGVTLSTILQNVKGFIYASGLSDALVTSGNLFLSFLSIIFIKALYKAYVYVYFKIYKIFTDGINVLAGSNTISL